MYCIGINKPGGIAWITKADVEKHICDVKYVLGHSRDADVPMEFITAVESTLADGGDSSRKTTPRRTRKRSLENTSSSAVEPKENTTSPARNKDISARSSRTGKPRMSLLSSHLDDSDQNKLFIFGSKFDADIAHNYCSSVTHLIVNVNKHKVLEQRTMKYLKALSGMIQYSTWLPAYSMIDMLHYLAGKWIVSTHWVQDCLANGALVEEQAYEVTLSSAQNSTLFLFVGFLIG